MICKTVIIVKQIVINGICDSYKWYHKNINTSYVIINDMFSRTCNLIQVQDNNN